MSKHLRSRRKAWAAIAVIAPGVALAALTSHSVLAQTPPAGGGENKPSDPALREYLSANGLLNRGLNELAVDEYRKFLSAHPDHAKAPVARYGLGVALFRLKNYPDAAKELEPLLQQADFEFAAETLLLVGQCAFEQKQWAQAAPPLTKMASENPTHDAADDAAVMAIESLYRLQQYEQIDALWSQFEKNWAESALRERADYLRGLSLVARKDDAAAVKHLAAMTQRQPQGQFVDRATLLRAQCLHRLNELVDAAAAYRALLDRDDALGADATFGMAVLSQQSGDEAAAAGYYDTFLKTWPDHSSAPSAMIDRGRLCVNDKQYDRARTLLGDGAAKDAARADEAAYWLAKCDLREEKYAAAADRLKEAIAAHPDSRLKPEMMYDRGVALAKADDAAAAIVALDEFRQQFTDHALEPDATALQATLEHQRQGYDASAKLCADFLAEHADHPQAAAVAFLAAEDDMLRDKFADAAAKYKSFLSKYPDDDQSRTARYRLGSAQYRTENYDDARGNLEQVVDGRKTDKAYRRGLLMLGDIAFQSERWEPAITLLGDYLSFGADQPSADDATLKLGLALARSDQLDKATEQFTVLIEQYPSSPHHLQAIFERGQAFLSQDKLDDANKEFGQVVAAGDSRFRTFALNHLATIAMRQQKWDEAASLYAQVDGATGDEGAESVSGTAMFRRGQALMAAKKYPEASRAFAAALERQPAGPNAAEAQAQRSIALSRSGEHEQALRAIEALSKLDSGKVSPELLAAVAYEQAWCLREIKRDDDAMAAYAALLEKHPNDVNAPHAMLELAEMQAADGDHAAAAELLAQLNEVASDAKRSVEPDVRERGLYRLAVSEFELKKYGDAATHAQAFIEAFPESDLIASAQLFAGESEFQLAHWQPASEHFEVITSKHPEDPGCPTALLRLGECQAQLQHWSKSEETFAQYLDRFGASELWFQAQFGVAYALENQSRQDKAIEAYRKVIDRHSGPTAARAQFQIGECLFAQKKHSDAVRELLKVDILYAYPEWSAAALYEAGRCFEELNQPDQARAQFAQVKEKYPDSEWAKLATQRLAANTTTPPTGGQ